MVKNPPANVGDTRDTGLIPGSRRSQEKEMATHSRTLAWKNPVDGGAWQATWGSQRVDQDLAADHTHTQLIYNVKLVFSVQRSASVIHTYTHTHVYFFLFHNLFHHGLSQDIGYSSLWCKVGPCWKVLVIQLCPTLCVSTLFNSSYI